MHGPRRPGHTRHAAPAAIVLAAGAALLQPAALAQPVMTESAKLLGSNGAAGDEFGVAVSLSGSVAVIGAAGHDGFFPNSGAAYIFRNSSGWSQQAAIAVDAASNDRFGTAVAADGDLVVVGAPLRDSAGSDAGAAYVYRYNSISQNWTLEATLTASDGASGNNFGAAVDVSGSVIIVGAPLGEGAFMDAGAAYVFRSAVPGSWTQEAKLTAPDGTAFSRFGAAVSLSGESAVIGAPFRAAGGAVYRFDHSVAWSTGGAFTPAGIGGSDRFGFSVAFDGARAIVGAPEDDASGVITDSGSAYILGWSGSAWQVEAPLALPAPATNDYYGYSVDICGARAIVGAYSTTRGALVDTGSAHVYRFDGTDWDAEKDLNATDAAVSDYFGYSVAVCETAVVGAYHDDPTGTASLRGSAYIFELGPVSPPDSDGDGLTDAEETTLGTNPQLADTDGDNLSDGAEVNTHFTSPILADTDNDGLSDGAEIATHLTDPLDADTDGDDLSDGDEVSTYATDPHDVDTDNDNLTDGEEVTLQNFGSCPNPLLPDSDLDGLTDDLEVAWLPALDPCDADFDNDDLSDGNEQLFGTDPFNPDTDGDGVLDGTEVDMAMGGPCPDPLSVDSDADGLSDGAELAGGTGPCNPDTDGDGAPDNIDPMPTVPGVTSGMIEDQLRTTSDGVLQLSLSLFDAPSMNAAWGRRLILAIELQLAANATSRELHSLAVLELEIMRRRIDEGPLPVDWMVPSPEKTQLRYDVDTLINWLYYEMQ